MSASTHGTTPYYYVPAESRHPVLAAAGLFFVLLGASQWINGHDWGKYSLAFGLAWWLFVLCQWFRDAARESEGGLYGRKIDISYRWSMSWFIFSDVMFFGAFFTALWWARAHSVPALGSLDNALLWPDFKAVWPSLAAGATASPANTVEPFQTVGPFWLPTINTASCRGRSPRSAMPATHAFISAGVRPALSVQQPSSTRSASSAASGGAWRRSSASCQ